MRAASDARPVSRILYGVAAADGHSSRPSIAERLKRPTRKVGVSSRDAWPTACAVIHSFPIWSCSVWGLPCVAHCCSTGALLPHLFTLTATVEHLRLCGLAPALPSRPGAKADRLSPFTYVRRYIFCGTFRRATPAPRRNAILKHPPGRYPAHCSAEFGLSSPRAEARGAAVRSGCLPVNYMRMGLRTSDFTPQASSSRLPASTRARILNSL